MDNIGNGDIHTQQEEQEGGNYDTNMDVCNSSNSIKCVRLKKSMNGMCIQYS